MNARADRRARRRISGVESGLPISSSELMTTTQSAGGRRPRSLSASQGGDHLHQAALHVEDAWPEQGLALDPDRHLADRPQRPDRVAVSDEHLKRHAPGPLARPGEQQAAGDPASVTAHGHPALFQLRGQHREHRRYRGPVVRRRLGQREPLQQVDHGCATALEITEDLIDLLVAHAPFPLWLRRLAAISPVQADGRPATTEWFSTRLHVQRE